MKCKNKGACCKDIQYLNGREEETILGNKIIMEIKDGVCIYLVDGKCSIYDERPQVCRDYFCPKCKYK